MKIFFLLMFTNLFILKAEYKKFIDAEFYRKSITIVPIAVGGSSGYEDTFIKSVNNLEINKRYDYNYLDKNKIKSLSTKLNKINFTIDSAETKNLISEIKKNIKETILMDILISATNIDSLNSRFERSQKNSGVSASSKEKISTFTIEDAYKFYNGTYISLPILHKEERNETEKSLNTLASLYWFRVNIDSVSNWDGFMPNIDQVNLDLLEYDNISGLFVASKYNTSEKDPDSKLSPIERSLKKLSENILISSYTIDDFKLRGVIQDVTPQITLDLGNREDVKLDDGFVIYENKIDNESKVYSEYVGFGRVEKVGDNNANIENRSTLNSIIGSYEEGNTAVSHFQLLDVVAKVEYRMVNIPQNIGYIFEFAQLVDKPILKDDATSSINLGLGFYYNTAPLSNISQLFAGLNFSFGIPLVEQNTFSSSDFSLNPTSTLEVNLAVLKKFWFSRFNGFTEIEFGINTFRFTGQYYTGNWELNTGYSYGVGLNVGIEYAITKDLNLAGQLGYRYVLAPSSLIFIDANDREEEYTKSENEEIWENSDLDDLNLGGLGISLRVSYSIPKLF